MYVLMWIEQLNFWVYYVLFIWHVFTSTQSWYGRARPEMWWALEFHAPPTLASLNVLKRFSFLLWIVFFRRWVSLLKLTHLRVGGTSARKSATLAFPRAHISSPKAQVVSSRTWCACICLVVPIPAVSKHLKYEGQHLSTLKSTIQQTNLSKRVHYYHHYVSTRPV